MMSRTRAATLRCRHFGPFAVPCVARGKIDVNGMHGQCDPVLHSDFPHQLATAVTSGWLLPFPKTEQKRISVILQGGKRYCETKAAVLGCSDRWKGTTRLGENRARRRDISHLGSPTCPPSRRELCWPRESCLRAL